MSQPACCTFGHADSSALGDLIAEELSSQRPAINRGLVIDLDKSDSDMEQDYVYVNDDRNDKSFQSRCI